jgi:CBS domain-containing protein
MKVEDVITPLIVSVDAGAPVAAAARLMRTNAVGFLPVREGGRVVGTVTDRDIAVRAAAGGLDSEAVRVEEVMTPSVVTVDTGTRTDEALHLMEGAGVSRLLVVDDRGQAVGVLSDRDILRPPTP